MYEFALERGWDYMPTNLEKWFEQYALGRYGQENDFIKKAWQLLRVRKMNKDSVDETLSHSKTFQFQRSVYTFNESDAIEDIVCQRPSFKLPSSVSFNK